MTRSQEHRPFPSGLRAAGLALPFLPLLLTAAPRSFLAHDEGYYALQARWIQESGQWLAPLWWGEPVYDRTIGAQWLIAASRQLLGPSAWAAHLPSLIAAVASLLLTAALARRLLGGQGGGWLAALLLALTPLWLNYAHQASQDMPLLALELLGLWALLRCQPAGPAWPQVLAGLWLGPAFLIKGFMVALPVAALLPLLLLRRRWLLARASFWGGLLLGWLPAGLWIGLSLRQFGPAVVGGLIEKLLYLSQSDVYSAGPLYYLWNIPANAAPWSLVALASAVWAAARGRLRAWGSEQRLVLLAYPLLLLLLLSCFRTKTPYYGLQLTPFLAIAAATGLRQWAQAGRARPRWLAWGLALLGGVLLVAGLAALLPASPLAVALTVALQPQPALPIGLAALALGLSWLALPWQRQRRGLLLAALAGPWLAVVLLVQTGTFTDRSPQWRLALEQPALAQALAGGPVAVVLPANLSGDGHAQLILLALASPQLGPRLAGPEALAPGQRAWLPKAVAESPQAQGLERLSAGDDLGEWLLVRARP